MQASAQKIWGTVQQSLQSLVSTELYRLWFSNIQPRTLDHDCLTLEVKDDFTEVWLEKNYLDLIREKAILAIGRPIKVKLEVGGSQPTTQTEIVMRGAQPKIESEPAERAASSAREVPFNPRN